MRSETITSAQNPKIKELLALQEKSRLRREKRLFAVEGRRELGHCIDAGFNVRKLFVCREICPSGDLQKIIRKLERSSPEGTMAEIVELPARLYEKVAYRGGTEGLIAEVRTKECTLDMLQLPDNPLVLVTESVEKPGNVGAMLRSCDAAGADAMIICGSSHTDLYNPNLIRASLGAVFTVPCAVCSTSEAIAYLRGHDIRILTAQLQDSSLYYDCDMHRGTALVMGTEATGLSDEWRAAADAHIRIPMLGRLDSLNVSVSAAILLFEAVRQRRKE